MTARRTRRTRSTARTLALTVAVAIGIHAVVLETVDATGLVGFGNGVAPEYEAAAAAPWVALESTCRGDAALAAVARATVCLGPFAGSVDACLEAARVALEADRIACGASSLVEVSFVQMSAEDIARIDPEPLLEILTAAEQLKHEAKQAQLVAELEQEEQQRQQQLAKREAQVVETAKPTVEVTPDQARFLAEYDTKVARETVARGARDEAMVARSQPEALEAVRDPAKDPSSSKPPPDRMPGTNEEAPDLPGKLSMRTPGAISPARAAEEARVRGSHAGTTGDSGDGIVARKGDGAIDQPRREADETAGHGGAGGGAPPLPDLKPSEDVLERALGGGSVDHLEAIDSGDETALNARRWVYASFFNRLKRQVAQSWEPASVWRRHDPTGAVYGFKTRVTQLRVSLDARGKLAKSPTVVQPCGVDVLDAEAVRAFEAAGPFPNPPGALAENGLITFEFSFHFEIGAPKTSWRILRQM